MDLHGQRAAEALPQHAPPHEAVQREGRQGGRQQRQEGVRIIYILELSTKFRESSHNIQIRREVEQRSLKTPDDLCGQASLVGTFDKEAL